MKFYNYAKAIFFIENNLLITETYGDLGIRIVQ